MVGYMRYFAIFFAEGFLDGNLTVALHVHLFCIVRNGLMVIKVDDDYGVWCSFRQFGRLCLAGNEVQHTTLRARDHWTGSSDFHSHVFRGRCEFMSRIPVMRSCWNEHSTRLAFGKNR